MGTSDSGDLHHRQAIRTAWQTAIVGALIGVVGGPAIAWYLSSSATAGVPASRTSTDIAPSGWIELSPPASSQGLRVWAARSTVDAEDGLRVHLRFASTDTSVVRLWAGTTLDRHFMNEWVLDGLGEDCHASEASARSVPRVTSRRERLRTPPLEVSAVGLTQWASFDGCARASETSTIRIRLVWDHAGQVSEGDFIGNI